MSNFTNIIDSERIQNTVLEFHTDSMPVPLFQDEDVKSKFGIITINIEKKNPIETPLCIYCNLDISDSMNEFMESNTKINYIKRTMQLLLTYLVENIKCEIWIQIGVFSTKYNILIPMQQLSSENINNLIIAIQNIHTDEATNIELALKETTQIMEEHLLQNPHFKHLHIFLTDGCPTEGNCNISELSKLVSQKYHNLFIGYGCDHNSELLQACAAGTTNSYQFVDNYEMAGQVYAEMIYSILNCSIVNPIITIENGFVYDAIKDEWTQKLNLPNWISEKEYIYHIKSSTIDTAKINIYDFNNKILYSTFRFPNLIDWDGSIDRPNLDKYIFKQKTMELLSKMLSIINNDELDNLVNIQQGQKEIADFYKCMRTYMRNNGLFDDAFMKILCEDLVISYNSSSTHYSDMHIRSRRNAQATQSLYRSGSSNTKPYKIQPNNHFKRSTNYLKKARFDFNEEEETPIVFDGFKTVMPMIAETKKEDEDDILNYKTEFITENIYSPVRMADMAREISRS